MILVKCKRCGMFGDPKIKSCSKCGSPLEQTVLARILTAVGTCFAGLVLLSMFYDGASPTKSTTPSISPSVTPDAPTTPSVDKDDLKKITALVLNLNGLLCAEVVNIRPLKVRPDVYEVTCIEYRGGSATKAYIMDAANKTAWVP